MSNKPEIKFKYVFSYNYNPVYVNGAHGGVSPRGELVVNFYLERPPLPNAITHEINPNGTIGNETEQDPEDYKNSFVRFVSDGIILNYDSARNIHQWLGDRIKEMEAVEQAKASMRMGGKEPAGGVTH
jgi:hypothetical protein